jgi:predicted Fe-Mo cluster-binding NifX family protein
VSEAIRIAVASSQGQQVDLHFGHADQFLIFDLLPGNVAYVGWRKKSFEGEESAEGVEDLDLVVDLLADCAAVVSMRAGPHARERLRHKGIACLEHAGIAGLGDRPSARDAVGEGGVRGRSPRRRAAGRLAWLGNAENRPCALPDHLVRGWPSIRSVMSR